ncbi:Cold-shock protein [Pseudomonas sp. 8AS]|uniref:DUF1294 domain-containing protein n=1 Tax=Pseudomonas sp. 8AS TaxID=2653163 RepID=UPI0012EEEEEA|nr:DUF1294 domain-containing protein [Pseudomonas sp. 8AS]VXC24130.1 Cold-shock protein [Pseudomonas sp. 8AS]
MLATERRGTLKSWNDAKGFGFIQAQQGGEQWFVHISALRGERRPQPGETVLFVPGKDAQGRLRAEHMRCEGLSLDRPAIRRKPRQPAASPRPAARKHQPAIRQLPLKLLLFIVLCGLPAIGALQLFVGSGAFWALGAYPLLSLISFAQYWHDKRSAQTGRWRTAENSLHVTELLGGWPGALLAQQLLRHKTRKLSFQLVFWAIVLLHQAFWFDRLVLGGRFLAAHLQAWLPLLR